MPTKKCNTCGGIKDVSKFFKDRSKKDGLITQCKQCKASTNARYKLNNREKILELKRKYYRANPDKYARWNYKTHTQKENERIEYRRKNPDKYRAHTALNHAVERGGIIKPTVCEGCGKKCRLSGHHEDYMKPLDVIWVCAQCHADIHRSVLEIV